MLITSCWVGHKMQQYLVFEPDSQHLVHLQLYITAGKKPKPGQFVLNPKLLDNTAGCYGKKVITVIFFILVIIDIYHNLKGITIFVKI